MSLEQRLIEPLYVFRETLPIINNNKNNHFVSNDLECMANGALSNIIRQLSSLASQAEDLFGSIVNESHLLVKKSESLQMRMYKLSLMVNKLDLEEENLNEINFKKNFKTTFSYDQEVLSRQTMPNFLMKKYLMCNKPPPLDKLNCFREDGKDGMKFYTDPNYFFDLWKNEMLKKKEKEKFGKKILNNKNLVTKQIEESHNNKQNKKPRKPENTTEKYRRMMSQQEFFADTIFETNENQRSFYNENFSLYGTIEIQNKNLETRKNKKPDVVDNVKSFSENNLNIQNSTNKRSNKQKVSVLAPSVPENIPVIQIKNKNVPQIKKDVQSNSQILPPPPLPPPLPVNNVTLKNNNNQKNVAPVCPPNNTSSFVQEILKKQQELKPAKLNQNSKPAYTDPRSNLLASIREGIQLRSVQKHKQKQVENDAPLQDVASILARRIAMELSDSESNHSANDSDNEWEIDN